MNLGKRLRRILSRQTFPQSHFTVDPYDWIVFHDTCIHLTTNWWCVYVGQAPDVMHAGFAVEVSLDYPHRRQHRKQLAIHRKPHLVEVELHEKWPRQITRITCWPNSVRISTGSTETRMRTASLVTKMTQRGLPKLQLMFQCTHWRILPPCVRQFLASTQIRH